MIQVSISRDRSRISEEAGEGERDEQKTTGGKYELLVGLAHCHTEA